MMDPEIYGLVLAGGKSTRMGTDKSLIAYHGKPQREYLFELLQPLCSRVFTSCHAAQDVPDAFNPITDRFGLGTPLDGILSAFQAHPACAWLTVAVDMPQVDDKALRYLLENRNHTKLATCYFNPEAAKPEPLVTLWEPSAFPLLKKGLQRGKVSPRDFLETHDVQLVQPLSVEIFRNVNYPSERPS